MLIDTIIINYYNINSYRYDQYMTHGKHYLLNLYCGNLKYISNIVKETKSLNKNITYLQKSNSFYISCVPIEILIKIVYNGTLNYKEKMFKFGTEIMS